jgi:hypothetical protein
MSVEHRKACLKKWYGIGHFEMKLYKPRNRPAQQPLPMTECWWHDDYVERTKSRKKRKGKNPEKALAEKTNPSLFTPSNAGLGSQGHLLLASKGLSLFDHTPEGLVAEEYEQSDPEDTFPDEEGEDADYPGIAPLSAPSNSEGRAQWSLITLNSIPDCADSRHLADAVKSLVKLPVRFHAFFLL